MKFHRRPIPFSFESPDHHARFHHSLPESHGGTRGDPRPAGGARHTLYRARHPRQHGLPGLIHSVKGGAGHPTSFEHEIHLFDSIVAGTSHVEGIHDIEPRLAIHDRLTFHREPGNLYDPQAIRVRMEEGTKIVYVPRQDNVIFANLMDAGKLLFGRIAKKELCGSWLHI